MIELPVLPAPIWTGIIMSVVLSMLFVSQERYKARKKRAQYAKLIAVELNHIYDIVRPLPWTRPDLQTNHLVGKISKHTYDGLVASSMISVFNVRLQRQLHTFYENLAARRYDYLRSSVVPLLKDVYGFEKPNEQRRHFFQWWSDGT